jgi:membrane protease YdiL (CAAX protease family)
MHGKRPLVSTLPFFLAAWTLSTLALLPAILAQHGAIAGPAERFAPLALFAVLSPTLAAMLVSRLERGGGGIRAVFRPLRDWRVAPVWYAIAFCIIPLALLLATAVYKGAGGSGDVHWLYPPRTPDRIVAMIMIPISEEIGWRGFALPRLQRRFAPLGASLLMGVGWGLWHIPMYLFAGVHFGWLLVQMVLFLVPGSVIYSWVFNRTRGVLPVAILMHVGIHSNNSMIPLPGNALPFHIHFAAVLVTAALVLADRKVWRARELQSSRQAA